MKIIAIVVGLMILGASISRAGEVILPYAAFGPQVAAYKLVGMEWWQWESHGDGADREYPIKVVVYWNQTREEASQRHPVNRDRFEDFRYVGYSKAIDHMTSLIEDFKKSGLDANPIERALAALQKAYEAEQMDAEDR